LMMKKNTTVVLGALALFGLSACSSRPDATTQPAVPASTSAQAQAKAAEVPTVNLADQAYAEQLALVTAKPDAAGYAKLRQLFVKTSRYPSHQLLEQALTGAIFQAIEQQDWQVCQDKAATLLKSSAISLNGHFTAMLCAEKTKNASKAAWHKQQLDTLIEAIWLSGDGKSAATAFFCTGTAELYAFIRLHGLTAQSQSLQLEQGKSYDVMELSDTQTKQRVTWYFDVSSQMAVGF